MRDVRLDDEREHQKFARLQEEEMAKLREALKRKEAERAQRALEWSKTREVLEGSHHIEEEMQRLDGNEELWSTQDERDWLTSEIASRKTHPDPGALTLRQLATLSEWSPEHLAMVRFYLGSGPVTGRRLHTRFPPITVFGNTFRWSDRRGRYVFQR